MNRLFWMIGLAFYVLAVLIFNPTSDVANARQHYSTCSAAAQTNASPPDGKHSAGGSTPGPMWEVVPFPQALAQDN